MSLRAANGSPLQVSEFITSRIILGDVSRSVDAIVILSLDLDQLLLDNATMVSFGAILDWKRQHLNFLSSKTSIPSVPRLASKITDAALSFVAAVHSDVIEHDVSLSERIDLKYRHVVVVTAYTINNTK